MIAIEEPCRVCGWPAAYAIHREDQRGITFVTAEGTPKRFVEGHAYAGPA